MRRDGLAWLRCDPLDGEGLSHLFSTRVFGNTGGFDLAGDPAERYARLARVAGILTEAPSRVRQVHGARVVRAEAGLAEVEADGVVRLDLDPSDRAPAVLTADCVPVLLRVRGSRAAAAVHAGWRGIAAGVVERALEVLAGLAGPPAQGVVAALGPSVGPCCYRVGDEVARALGREAAPVSGESGVGQGRPGIRVDLARAVADRLAGAGVPATRIHLAGLCTACLPAWFFSYRRDGTGAGRMLAWIGPEAGVS